MTSAKAPAKANIGITKVIKEHQVNTRLVMVIGLSGDQFDL